MASFCSKAVNEAAILLYQAMNCCYILAKPKKDITLCVDIGVGHEVIAYICFESIKIALFERI